MNELKDYFKLSNIFKDHGFKLYLVGGTVRDFLLKIELSDIDLTTNATPNDMREFLTDADFSFAKFGFVKLIFNGKKFDITTLRKESGYDDSRHPSKIEFIDNLEIDVRRRDFTCNGLYMDENLAIYDYVNGQEDLKNNILRIIGNADERIKEDPLRIIRAIRFYLTYNLVFDDKLYHAIINNKDLLKQLNQEKIKEDISKIKNASPEQINNLLNKLGINLSFNMVKL